jgi:hypothetical protein
MDSKSFIFTSSSLTHDFLFLSPAAIGKTVDSGETIRIGDKERRAGLYILGGSGTGKTELIKTIILQDIENGHGIFFLDPHGDAIDDLIERMPEKRVNDVVCLDVRDRNYSFGINLLSCKDISDISEREDTFTMAKNVFNKLWENMLDDKPWLQLITQQALRVFIENPDYALSELPIFLTNTAFRNHLISRVKHYPDARHFWREEYNPRQREATLARARTILGDTYYRHIVSQTQTTIDFSEIIENKKILLIKLSVNLSLDAKKFIGTTLVSSIVHAVLNRDKFPPDKRHQFCIFVDEVQNFTTSDDFAVLFTQARKFGIATTIAHQERFGQIGDNRALSGATAGAGNKVVFQLTGKDAQELAPEFADTPDPTEDFAISHEPVADLLRRGHKHPAIQEFTYRFLRRRRDHIKNIRDEFSQMHFKRLGYLDEATIARDEASIYQADARIGSANVQWKQPRGAIQDRLGQASSYLESAKEAHERASDELDDLQRLQASINRQQEVLRFMDTCFVAIMLGKKVPAEGQEWFAQMLKKTIDYGYVNWERVVVMHLYILLMFGDPAIPRSIPSYLAIRYYPTEVDKVHLKKCQQTYMNGIGEARDRYTEEVCRELAKVRSWGKNAKGLHISNEDKFDATRFSAVEKNAEGKHIINWEKFAEDYRSKMPKTFKESIEFNSFNGFLKFDLPVRILNKTEIEELLAICHKELSASVYSDASVEEDINFFTDLSLLVETCYLLTKPENYIRVPTGQPGEKRGADTVRKKIDVMSQELSNLPRFSAYAKVLQEKDGQQSVIKEKIETSGLPKISEDVRVLAGERRVVIEENSRRYGKRRDVIEEEIVMRQEAWIGEGLPPPRSDPTGGGAKKGGPPPRSSRPPPS